MLKKIEVEIDATCESCSNYKNKSFLPSDVYICELDGVVVSPTDYCVFWVLCRPIFNDSPRSFMILDNDEC